MRSVGMILLLTFAFLFAATPAALCQGQGGGQRCRKPCGVPGQEVAAITVNVTAAPAKAEARAAAKGRPEIKMVNGQPLMRLTAEANGQTVEAPQGTYILLRFSVASGAVGFTVTPPGILEPPKGIYHLPSGAIGILRAAQIGTAKVVVAGIQPRPGSSRIIHGTTAPNWSGYGLTNGPFLSVSGEWTVPTVYGDAGDHSSTWIGIDGFGNDNLIQTGTEQDYSSGFLGTGLGGGPEYSAWWEVLPADSVQISNPVSPGDHMIGIVSLNGDPAPGSPMQWLIFLMDETKNWTFTKTVTYSGNLLTAEWIEERPTECGIFSCSYTDLADYGQVTFDVFDTVNSLSPAFTPAESILLTEGSTAYSTPSDPDGDKDGFTIAYGADKPEPPGPIIFTTSLPQAYLNTPYQAHLHVTGDYLVHWFASNLPAWLALDENSGVLSGTPPAASLNFFSVVARDINNQNVSSQVQPLEVTVEPTPPPPDFSLSAAPQAIHLAFSGGGCLGSTTITVNPLYGFNAPVQLTAAGTGIASAQFNPASTTSTSHLVIHANFCRSTGNNDTLVAVTGTSGAIKHSIVVDLVPLSFSGPCDTPEGRKLQICNPVP
jgi:hypothetical protein